jgi:hypothetical protein
MAIETSPHQHLADDSTEMELLVLAVFGFNSTHRPGRLAHDDGVSFDDASAKSDTAQHRPSGDAGRRKQTVPSYKVFDLILSVQGL